MIKDILTIVAGVVVIALLVVFLAWLFHYQYDSALPVTGTVVEKISAGTGYNDYSRLVLKLEIAEGSYLYIAVSSRVYGVVVTGSSYRFTGPRNGTSYNGVVAVE